jgi:hypothetical protein
MGSQSVGDLLLRAHPPPRAIDLMDLTPGRLDLIRQVLEEELRKAYRDALDRGVSAAAADDAIADRRRALEALALRFVADDPQDAVDDAGESDGVGQKRG